MEPIELAETLLDALAELSALYAAAAAAADRAWTALAEHADGDLDGALGAARVDSQSLADRPLVNASTFTVEWRGRRCDLGPSIPFKLLQRLLRRPDRYHAYHVLMADVWNRRCSHAAVRSAVKRLRRALCEAGMGTRCSQLQARWKPTFVGWSPRWWASRCLAGFQRRRNALTV